MVKKKLDYKTILDILDFWLDDFSNNYDKIPPKLKNKITNEDITSITLLLKKDYSKPDSKIFYAHDFDNLRNEIILRIKTETELESIKTTKLSIKKQIQLQQQTKNLQKWQTIFIFTSVIIATFSLIIASLVGWNNIQLMSKQSDLINNQLKSLSPLRPDIHILIDDENELVYSIKSLTQKYYNQKRELLFPPQHIKIIIQNIGQMDSGEIKIGIFNESLIMFPQKRLNNLPGESSFIINIEEFWFADCRKYNVEDSKECEKPKLNPGITKLKFQIECEYCTEKKITKYFDVCFWETEEDCTLFQESFQRLI